MYTNTVKVCLSVWHFAGVWHTASQEVRFSPTNLRQELERHCLEISKEQIYSFFSNSYSFILWNALSSIFDTQAHDASVQFSSVQSLSRVQLFVTPWTAARQASLSIINSQSLLKLMSIELVMPFNHLILCRPLLLLPSIFPSIGVFSNESVLPFRWPKYWTFSFSISLSNEYSGLISFRMDWLDLLAVQGTLKSLLQHHSSKASVLRCSAIFIVQLTPILTTGKTIAMTRLCWQSNVSAF